MSNYTSFKEYMFYLLHKPLKNTTLYKLFTVLGAEFDEVQETIFRVREQSSIITATGRYLDLHGKDRDMYRYRNEDDEAYRKRLILKFEISKRAGTLKGLELVLKSMGYNDAEIIALFNEDETRWAEFSVYLNSNGQRLTLQDVALVHNEIMKVKQASSKPTYYAKNELDVPAGLVNGTVIYKRKKTLIKAQAVDCTTNENLVTGTVLYIKRKITIKGGSV